MKKLGYIIAGLLFLIFSGCEENTIFRPNINCEYPPQYGLAFVAQDTAQAGPSVFYVNLRDSDTVSFAINSFVNTTLFYLKSWQAIGFVDSANVLTVIDLFGNTVLAKQLPWKTRQLAYDNTLVRVMGVGYTTDQDTVNYIFGLSLYDGTLEFKTPLGKNYVIDTAFYFYNPNDKTYYIRAFYNDTLWLLGYGINEGNQGVRTELKTTMKNVRFNYSSNQAIGLSGYSGQIKLVKLQMQDYSVDSSVTTVLSSAEPFLSAMELSRQYYVAGVKTTNGYEFLFLNITTGQPAERHGFEKEKIYEVIAWSALSY